MENTSGDFWRMIVERDCRVIVMLNLLKEGEASSMEQEVCYQYWPDTDIKKYGEYSVELIRDTENDDYVERIFSVKDKVNRKILLLNWDLLLSLAWCVTWGDSVPDTELELSGQVLLPTDHHHCGRGGQQGAAQDWQQTHCGPLQVSSTSHHYQHMMILSSRRQWHCQQVRDVLCHSYHHWSLQDWECGGCVPGGEGPAYPEARSCSHSGEYHIAQTMHSSLFESFTTGAVPVCVWGCTQIPGVLWNILQLQVIMEYKWKCVYIWHCTIECC